MANRYRYTDGATANSVSGSGPFTNTPWDSAISGVTARARPATRQGIYDELVLCLQDAGLTEFVQTAGADSVWFSAGEDGLQHICIRTRFDGRYLYIDVAPKLDASNLPQGGIGGAATHDRCDLGAADFTADFHCSANLDRFWFVVQNVNHTATMFVLGSGNLDVFEGNQNVLITSGAVSAGDFVTILTTTNPLSLGFRAGDVLQVVEVAAAGSPLAERFRVHDVTTTGIVAESLASSYSAAARIGVLPNPVFRFLGANTEVTNTLTAGRVTTPYYHRGVISNDLVALDGFASGIQEYGASFALGRDYVETPLGNALGTGTTANERTQRFTCREVGLMLPAGERLIGALPGLFAYPGTPVYYPHDDMENSRSSPLSRYVPLRFTATSTQHFMMGPTPQ